MNQSYTFDVEKKQVLYTVITFSVSFTIKILATTLQMIGIFTTVELGEFWTTVLECCLSVGCELVPLYCFIYQHIKNMKAVGSRLSNQDLS